MASVPETAVAPPAEKPEQKRDDEFPRWPLWGPLAAVVIGAAVAFLVVGIIAAFLQSAGPKLSSNSPWFTSLTAFGLDAGVVAATIAVASRVAPPRPWQFGLRRAPLLRSLVAAFLAVIAFLTFELVYAAVVDPKNPQKIVDDLGADKSTALLVTGALAVILVAPIAEEIFFRGFLFRVLRSRMSFWLAAVIDGVLFGLVHGSFVIVPILAVLGVALCWVYERTGSLFPCIAIHALNNTLAYGAGTDNGWPVAGAIGGAMLVACLVVPRLLPEREPSPVT
jgi:membrane protease YdiL (CAAX protease family)